MWHDWLRNDRTLLAALMLALIGAWLWTREPKLFELVTTILGALLGLVTNAVMRDGRNGGDQ